MVWPAKDTAQLPKSLFVSIHGPLQYVGGGCTEVGESVARGVGWPRIAGWGRLSACAELGWGIAQGRRGWGTFKRLYQSRGMRRSWNRPAGEGRPVVKHLYRGRGVCAEQVHQ